MRSTFIVAVLGLGLSTAWAAEHPAPSAAAAPQSASSEMSKEEKHQLGYALGTDLGRKLHSADIQLDTVAFQQGLNEAMTEQPSRLKDEQINKIIGEFQSRMMANLQKKFERRSSENKAKGEAFFKENKTKPGVVATSEGWQYKILKEGKGAQPGPNDKVTVNYEGRLLDGKVFDSSYKRNSTVTFKLDEVIRGWQLALQKMPQGSTWEIYLPSDLAYGEQGVPGMNSPIGPNETLIFKVELVNVEKTSAPPKPKS